MGLININDMQTGDDATAELWNSRYATIVNAINGNIDSANLTDGAVTAAKLASNSVTTAKINDGAVTAAKLVDSAVAGANMGTPVAFHAYRSATKSIGSSATDVAHDTERYDYGSNFNTSTGVFTAPYAGIYSFKAAVLGGASATRIVLQFVCSTAGTFTPFDVTGTAMREGTGNLELALEAGETVKVKVLFSGGTFDVANTNTFFAGHLVGRTS